MWAAARPGSAALAAAAQSPGEGKNGSDEDDGAVGDGHYHLVLEIA